jgi:hypothetical protein
LSFIKGNYFNAFELKEIAMIAFVEKNEKFLRFSFNALRISGWGLLVLGIVGPLAELAYARFQYHDTTFFNQLLTRATLRMLHITFLGLFGIGLAQLVRYLLDPSYVPGFILRHSNKFIYAYVILSLSQSWSQVVIFIHSFPIVKEIEPFVMQHNFFVISNSAIYAIFYVAKCLILIGFAQLLKRIIPIIQESRTLV